ncbi:MAG: sigma-54-dependent Fis family transcriptional regulator [Ignavibacteriales bacterium]|nr:sigma-54-dependent Fis family transcriptional regulator [Ignavibacteriales bacterium]
MMSNEDIKILVVDDEVNSTILLKKVLEKKGYAALTENDSKAAMQLVEEADFDIIISDLQMPDVSGLDLLRAKKDDTLFIMITGFGSIDSAVEAMKLGAFDYIGKPFNLDEFILKFDKAVENIRLNSQVETLRSQLDENSSFSSIIGKSRKMLHVFDMIKNVARTDANVLIEGQSGTGKELVAKAIHYNSSRAAGPFIAINCSAIPDNLLESELFGHTKGAYTGAVEAQKGVFELAHGGTLLLDEIAEMPFNLQSKLLRVIETWEIKPLGSDKVKKVDVRLLSATNRVIKEMIDEKKFREDLFYRIATVTISLPSLNERKDDIPILADHFIKKISAKMNKNVALKGDAIEVLTNHNWPGNVRELENVIERAVISSDSDMLGRHNFKFLVSNGNDIENITPGGNLELKDLEKVHIRKVLEENGWNKLQAAKILGIDRKTLYKKIKEYELE